MLNIVMPMAGRATRFTDAGVTAPKPLVPVRGVPMALAAIRNVRPSQPHRFVFVVQEAHNKSHDLGTQLMNWTTAGLIVNLLSETQGAACSVYKARDYIPKDHPLLIANCDQWWEYRIDEFLKAVENDCGGILTMRADKNPKLSYVVRDRTSSFVQAVVEKQIVSQEATAGAYYFKHARYFFEACEEMVDCRMTVNGEYYVAPVYNFMIQRGMVVRTYYMTPRQGLYGTTDGIPYTGYGEVHGLDSPDLVKKFESLPVSPLWEELNGKS